MHRSKNSRHRVNQSCPHLNEMKPQLKLTPDLVPETHCLIAKVHHSYTVGSLCVISQIVCLFILIKPSHESWLLANCVKMIHDRLGRFSNLVFVLSFLGKFRFLVSVNEFDGLIASGRLHTWKKITQLVKKFMLKNFKAINNNL